MGCGLTAGSPHPPGSRAKQHERARVTLTFRKERFWQKALLRNRNFCIHPSRPLLPGGCY